MKASVLAMLVLVTGFVSHCSSQDWHILHGKADCPGNFLNCHLSCLLIFNASTKGVCDGPGGRQCACILVGCPNNPQGCQYVCSKNLISKRYRCGGYKNQFCRCFE
ncbi:uncharacterized protein LOC120850471 [Ixodes scapularis]|uniref:uncharacterized protein LOC120850471 n=1 Tax=Ixodes scapularis TaxID=6945 RepID=UPI001C3852E9|nr:uncharacterized protein LOC120850471 [Ixodes scapularis]